MNKTLAAAFALIAVIDGPSAQPVPPSAALQRIGRNDLCVTNGMIVTRSDGRLAVDTPSSRAVVRIATAPTVEIRFRYLGPSERSAPLASGELRRQIGLKLRAQDTCNLIYAMWHIEPDSNLAVAIKRNADKHSHAQCGARGYTPVKARTSTRLPRIAAGETHTLRAELNANEFALIADGSVAWEGTLGDTIADLDGPVGLRTDNARFEFEYYVGGVAPGAGPNRPDQTIARCAIQSED